MADLKRNPILILRFDGEDLKEFFCSTQFEPEMITIFSQIQNSSSLRNCIMMALEQLTVDHGLPPPSDPWVYDNIVDPALQLLSMEQLERSASEEIFLEEFKKLICDIIKGLQDQPIIVAHTQNTFDGSGIRRLLSNKFELNKLLDLVWRGLPKEFNAKSPSEFLRVALDGMATSADLPCYGTVDQVDTVVDEVLGMIDVNEEKILRGEQFKKMMTDVLGNLMLQLEGNPIFISSNSVVHEPLASPSTVLPLSTFSQQPEI